MSTDQKTSGQHAKKKPLQSVISVLKRHRKLLTLVGTVIVFFTFVFRYVLREKARGTKDSYESAASSFSLMDEIINVSDRVRHLQVVVQSRQLNGEYQVAVQSRQPDGDYQVVVQSRQPNGGYQENSRTLRDSMEMRIDDLEHSILNIKRVCETLPTAKIERELSEVENVQTIAQKIGADLPPAANSNLKGSEPPNASELPSSSEPIAPSSLKAFYDQKVHEVKYELQPEIKNQSEAILKVLASESENAAWWYAFFDFCSFYLYVLGIVVTAVGQVIGKDNEGAAIGSE
jgi:hypothetical protein